MEADLAACCGSDHPHPPSLWGVALLPSHGKGGESALRSVRGAASRHPPAAGVGWTLGPLEQEKLSSGVVLSCGTVPCISLLPGQVPPALPEGPGALFLEILTLPVVHC